MDVPEERVQISIAESKLLKEYLAVLPPDAWDAPRTLWQMYCTYIITLWDR